MRPGQNKRMRGRNRRGPNPLTRSFESNGPDVKVRGTAQHVAEKYTQLARDAHVSGDPVMAESYLQHAEHYYRLIAAAHQAQVALQNGTADENDDEDDFDTASDRFNVRAVQQSNAQSGQQSYSGERGAGDSGEGDDQPQERQGQERQGQERQGQERQGFERQDRNQNRNDRNNNRGRDRNQDRNFRQNNDRQSEDRSAGGDRNPDRDRSGFQERGGFNPNRPRRPQPDLEGAEQPILPAFLTAPVRAIPIEVPESVVAAPAEAGDAGGEAGATPLRVRRRRRTRVGGEGVESAAFETEASGSEQT